MRESFLQHLKEHYESVCAVDALLPFREKAWNKLAALGMPEKKNDFQYVSLRELYETKISASKNISIDKEQIAHAILPECAHAHVVFVNGYFCPHLSDLSQLPSGILLLPLSAAMRSHGHFLQSHLSRSLKEEKDPFALLNLALHPAGAFLYVPAKYQVENPIQFLSVTIDEEAHLNAPRLQLVLGSGSLLNCIETQVKLRGEELNCAVPFVDLFLDEGAQCDFLTSTRISPLNWHFDSVRAFLKRDAKLKVLSLLEGSKATRRSIYAQLFGENSEVDLKGLWMLKSTLQAHAHVTVEHLAPHARSNQLFKGILLGASQSSFEGKIAVRQAAQKTQAYQLNNNLILGKAAVANSKPNLEIFADDVKASHGATIARPEETQIFYLKSRGIDEALAKQLLMAGFYREIIDQIQYTDLRQKLLLEKEVFCE